MKTATAKKTETFRRFEMVGEILEKYECNPEKLIPILQAVQHEYRYLPEPVMMYIANALDISPARLYGVATFYAHFALAPKGKYVIRICDGTACHVKGSMNLHEVLHKALGLAGDQKTTEDLLFTLETVSCLGACGLAPVMMVNDKVYGQLTADRAAAIIDEIRTREVGEGV
jgi:NADH-quinone oxidoreductase subunit E